MVAEQSRPVPPPLVRKRWPGGVECPAIMRAVAYRRRLPEFAWAARAMRWGDRQIVVLGVHVWAHCGIVLARCPLPEPVDCPVPPILPVFAAMPWTDPASGVVDLLDAMEADMRRDVYTCDPSGERVLVVLDGATAGGGFDGWAIRLDVVEMLLEHGVKQLDVVPGLSPRDPQVRLPYFRFRSGVVEGIVLPCGPSRGWSSEEED